LYLTGSKAEALDYLKQACSLAASLGYDQFLVLAAGSNETFLTWASDQWDSPQLKSLIRQAAEKPIAKDQLAKPPEEQREVKTSIQVAGFGREIVRLDGEVIRTTKWHSVGTRAMFFFILDRKEVTKEEIALEFWPDFSPGKVNSNFHATLWRVRNALGGKHMIQFKGNTYLLNPEVNLHYDVEQFEWLFGRLRNEPSGTERRTLLRQIVELYQGDFLVNIDMSWADQKRVELQNAFVHALSELAKIELERGNIREAMGMYENLISRDPYQDEFHLGKIECLVRLDNVNSARRHYTSYLDLLDKELGIKPDQEIIDYMNSL
jgi:two-component SAPR family response regulator